MVDWRKHICINPKVCHGQACVRGTRIMITIVLDNLEAGTTEEEMLKSYPTLTREDIDAVRAYAAELARRGTVDIPRVGD